MFTWGDSGAFPLWYLQGVERMREDVDLPHTPHLVFGWYLNSMPRLFKDSTLRTYGDNLLPIRNKTCASPSGTTSTGGRLYRLSTRYSTTFTSYIPVQKGIVYRMRRANEPVGLPDLSVWENYNNRGILDKISFLDLDTGKAILIYANSYLEAGEFLMGIGRQQEGRQMLEKAVRISPEMKNPVLQVIMRYGGVQ